MNRIYLALALVAALGACAHAPTPDQAIETNSGPTSGGYPLSAQQRATTSEDIYLGNLQARIEVLDQQLASAPSAAVQAQLAAALLLRFRVLGQLADGERGLELATSASQLDPDLADAQLILASALSTFHRFDEAMAALERAAVVGADAARLATTRRDLLMAQGRYQQLADDFARSAEPVADFYELAHRADLRLLQGDPAGASQWYRAAQDLHQDVDPLPLAWLYVQQGIALLRHDQITPAREFFAAAHARLPHYALATEHLAECEFLLGHHDRARQLYVAVIEQTDNPEYRAALARVEEASGHPDRAQAERELASRGYQDLLQRHRAAYAQHAAQFFLDIGDVDRAWLLAQENLQLRSDLGSLILYAQAAEQSKQPRQACAALVRIQGSGLQPPELAGLTRLQDRCSTQ
ncbi:MAG: tetratricopeptide repeat protein [Lysobacterales bacterium]